MLYKNFDKTIRKILIDEDVQIIEVANKLEESPQNLNGKLKRETIRLMDVEKILNVVGYELLINKKSE